MNAEPELKEPTTPADVLPDEPPIKFDCSTCGASVEVPAFLSRIANDRGVMCAACCDKDSARILKTAIESSREIRAHQFTQICPAEYLDTDPTKLPKGNRLNDLLNWEYGRIGFFLIGKTRAGKSRCAWMLAKREFLSGKSVRCLDYSSAFAYGSKFQDGVKDAQRWIEKHCTCDLLLLDDVFKAKLSDSFEQAIFIVIARRSELNLPMIITANDNPDTLKARMTEDRGPAIVSRLKEFCQVLVFGL